MPEFLESELERRRELDYPPFRRLVRLLLAGPEQQTTDGAAAALAAAARPALEGDAVLGPAPLHRLRDRARVHLLVKTSQPRRRRRSFAAFCAT